MVIVLMLGMYTSVKIINIFSEGIPFRHHNLTYKIDPREKQSARYYNPSGARDVYFEHSQYLHNTSSAGTHRVRTGP